MKGECWDGWRKCLVFSILLGAVSSTVWRPLTLQAQGDSLSPATGLTDSSRSESTQMTKSPTTAVLYSLLFPGGGQLYNREHTKSILFAGGAGFYIVQIAYNNSQYQNFKNLYEGAPAGDSKKDYYVRAREFYNNERDLTALYLLGVYVISAIDAYVDAHLFDFDVSDSTVATLFVSPVSASFQLKF